MEDVPQSTNLEKLNNIFRGYGIDRLKINYNMYEYKNLYLYIL